MSFYGLSSIRFSTIGPGLVSKITGNQHQCHKWVYCIKTVSTRQTEGLNGQQKAAKYIYDVFKTETTDNVLKQTSTADELKTSLKHTNRRQHSWCVVFPKISVEITYCEKIGLGRSKSPARRGQHTTQPAVNSAIQCTIPWARLRRLLSRIWIDLACKPGHSEGNLIKIDAGQLSQDEEATKGESY